jgi:hypothetical protein
MKKLSRLLLALGLALCISLTAYAEDAPAAQPTAAAAAPPAPAVETGEWM